MSTTTQQSSNNISVSENLFTGAAGVTAVSFGEGFIAALKAAINNLETMGMEIETQQNATVAEADKTKKGGRKGAMGYYFQAAAKAGQGLIGVASAGLTYRAQSQMSGEITQLKTQSENLSAFEGLAKEPARISAAGNPPIKPLRQGDLDDFLKGDKQATTAELNAFAERANSAQRAEMLQKITSVKNELATKEGALSRLENNYQMKARAAEAAVGAGGDFGQGYESFEKAQQDALALIDNAIGQAAQGSYGAAQKSLDAAISLLNSLLEAQKGTAQATSRN